MKNSVGISAFRVAGLILCAVLGSCASMRGPAASGPASSGAPVALFTPADLTSVITTGSYRVVHPADWSFARSSGDGSGVFLEGSDARGEIAFSAEVIPFPAETSLEVAARFFASRIASGGSRSQIVPHRGIGPEALLVLGEDESEAVIVAVSRVHDSALVVIVSGPRSRMSADPDNAALVAAMVSVDTTPRIVRRRGEPPHLNAPDMHWQWVGDLESGLVLAGDLDGIAVAATVTRVASSAQRPADGSSAHLLFSGSNLYRVAVTPPGAHDAVATVQLTGDEASYSIEVRAVESSNGMAGDIQGLIEGEEFAMLVGQYLVLE